MAKPSVIPAWATNGVEIATPSGPKQISGWASSEKPAHTYMNWLQNAAWQWIVWLNGLQAEALTWTALNTFSAGLVITQSVSNQSALVATGNGTGNGGTFSGGATSGSGLVGVGTGGNAIGVLGLGFGTGAGVSGAGHASTAGSGVEGTGGSSSGRGLKGTGGASAGTGVEGIGGAGGGAGLKGTGTDGGDGLQASSTTGGNGATLSATGGGVGLRVSDGGISITGDSEFSNPLLLDSTLEVIDTVHMHTDAAVDGALTMTDVVLLNGADHATPGNANELSPRVVPKMWANIALNGSSSPTLTESFNVTGVTVTSSKIVITFNTAMANNLYAVMVTIASNLATLHYFPGYDSSATGSVKITLYDNTGALVNAAGLSGNLSVLVMGRQ